MSGLVFFAVLIAQASYLWLIVVSARPNANIGTQNVVTVPPNCPSGQQWINGACRDVWRQSQHDRKNVIVVPPNCLAGQQWINGHCRDVWREGVETKNTVTVSPNCPNGQGYVNGQCRDIIWRQDMIDPTVMLVPPNCPDSQEYINGKCRDSWIERNTVDADFKYISSKNWFLIWFETLKYHRVIRSADEGKAGIWNRSIFDIPKHCPKGQSADSMGYCRPVFDQRI